MTDLLTLGANLSSEGQCSSRNQEILLILWK